MAKTKNLIATTLNFAIKNEPPRRPVDAALIALRGQEESIKSAIEKGWKPAQLAKKLRDAGVKVSHERLRLAIQEIAGVQPRTVRKGTITDASLPS